MERIKQRRNVQGYSKRQENSIPDSVDMISPLPDPILGTILSFLPTKEAVATSVLSKRFQFMWRTVHNLEFFHLGYREERYEGEDMKFVEFVNRVLLLHDSSLLHKFNLFWKPRCILSHVNSWIRTAITKNVQDLLLCVLAGDGAESGPEPIEMPISVFNCDSLRFLELDGGISFYGEDVICLPGLESLKLFSVDFKSMYAFDKLITGCPVLNFLLVHIDTDYMIDHFGRGDHDFTYIVFSTSLRRFVLCVEPKEELHELNFYCNLLLKTPSLEYLTIDGHLREICVKESLSSLVEANLMIDLYDEDFHETYVCNSVVEVVRAFDCAKTITLSGAAMWALSHAEISLSTDFKRLLKFETQLYCCHCCWPLRDFIQCSDSLEVLTINQDPNSLCSRDLHVHSNWNAPVQVPKCLSNSLKTVVVDVYCGFADEREMIHYILKHGSALELINIALDRNREPEKFELIQEICKFPRKSPACEVEFAVDQYEPDPVVTS